MIGISVYAGMENSIEEILEYMEKAYNLGITLLFTSAHIPEVKESFTRDFETVLSLSTKLGYTTIVDISKGYYDQLELNKYKIDYIRLDYGFTIEEAAYMTQKYAFGISINATTFDR
ncbi:MupG family TIM beta-alpha barrel fold protein, partial [Schnuerera ultunensis]